MARDQSGSAALSPDERAASKRAGHKRLGKDGCPEDRPPEKPPADTEQDVVPENEQPGFIDEMRGM